MKEMKERKERKEMKEMKERKERKERHIWGTRRIKKSGRERKEEED